MNIMLFKMIIFDLLRNFLGISIIIIYDVILLYIIFQFIIVQLLFMWGLGKNGEWVVLQVVLYFIGLEYFIFKVIFIGYELEVICVVVFVEFGLVLSGLKGNVIVYYLF